MVEKQKNPNNPSHRTKPQNSTSKSKAPKEIRRGREGCKRQKHDGKDRVHPWSQNYDRYDSASEDGEYDRMSGSDEWFDGEYNRPVKIIERPQNLVSLMLPENLRSLDSHA